MSHAWMCAYQGGPHPVEPTCHATEQEAEARAQRLATQGIRGAVVYRITVEDPEETA